MFTIDRMRRALKRSTLVIFKELCSLYNTKQQSVFIFIVLSPNSANLSWFSDEFDFSPEVRRIEPGATG